MSIAGWKSLLEQIIHCKNYHRWHGNPTIQNTQYLWTHLLRLQCIDKELPKNKVTKTLMSECYYDFDQYVAHVKQIVHIRPPSSHYYHLTICPIMVPRLIFQGKDTVVEWLYLRGDNLLHISIYCNHLPAWCFSRIQWEIKHWVPDWDWSITYRVYSHKQLSSWVYGTWNFLAKGQYFGEVTKVFREKWLL